MEGVAPANAVRALSELIAGHRLFVLTGAGISTEGVDAPARQELFPDEP